jgi:hypothetical protein
MAAMNLMQNFSSSMNISDQVRVLVHQPQSGKHLIYYKFKEKNLSLWFLGAEAVLRSSAVHLGHVHRGVA